MADKKRWLLPINEAPTPFQIAMMLLSLISVIVVLTITFGKLETETRRLLLFVDTSICSIFISYFLINLFRADSKLDYFKRNWIDLVASIPAIEPLRMARLFQILRVIRLLRMTRSILIPLMKQRRQATLASLLVAMVSILTFSSMLILIVEAGDPQANIHTAEDAIWWSLVTISTVGYGDYYPVTTIGHVIGGVVIVCGVSFFGVISGYMASLFIAPDESEKLESQRQEIRCEIESALARMELNQQSLLQEIAELKQQQKGANNKPED
ncbi:ion transporter [Shewanella sp. Isolate11]|uniref:ion transporter n=1 Tax=Shewanella sp. Isolate11 TaxID=2908530 RepID=UPI001EFCC5A7|nr:ion transporter [Shewanella sp. Isolate11]MCG9697553.1 ion transporter [Shewanella sp. Isolate11]